MAGKAGGFYVYLLLENIIVLNRDDWIFPQENPAAPSFSGVWICKLALFWGECMWRMQPQKGFYLGCAQNILLLKKVVILEIQAWVLCICVKSVSVELYSQKF